MKVCNGKFFAKVDKRIIKIGGVCNELYKIFNICIIKRF